MMTTRKAKFGYAALSCTVFLAVLSSDSLSLAYQGSYLVVSEALLESSRGLDGGSSLNQKGYNCNRANADTKDADPNDPDSYVDSNKCSDQVKNPDTGKNEFSNEGKKCILCPVVGQSITINNDSVASGYAQDTSMNCDSLPGSGLMGTCDSNGACANKQPFTCSTKLTFYLQQLHPDDR